ncbi:multiheme c-type cytochrome [Breoghania sp. L-A4]|uniref:multiheme c-type cytochrome n=1 Tax=Breoghania sp. L-A4 TaxID=2304600 RepID=UPI0013C37063|nr:multiheme c-type cytochrome [Breoghania sp. L-A4]
MVATAEYHVWPRLIAALALLSWGAAVPASAQSPDPFASQPPLMAIHSGRAGTLAQLERYLEEIDAGARMRLAANDDLLLDAPAENDSLLDPAPSDDLPGAGQPAPSDDLLSGSSDDLLNADDSGDDLLAPSDGSADSLLGGGDDLLAPSDSSGDTLLGGDDDLLAPSDDAIDDLLLTGDDGGANETEEAKKKEEAAARRQTANAEHEKLFLESKYPSANTCATCHPRQYEDWSASQHAYAQLSPIYMAMQTTINMKTSATNGDFCIRCHNPVGMNLGESLYVSNLKRTPTSREGITCVACHRVNKNYGKISGRFALEEGDVFSPVYGPKGGQELRRVLNSPEEYRVSQSRDDPGRSIHTEAKPFFALTKPGFCGTCHDVTLFNGFRLEEAFAEYKQTPAARRGETCQDCHMGKVQGVASGYDYGPAAIVGDVPTRNRKLANHTFAGPDYSIIHPGIFPHNVEAAQLKTLEEWLQFNDRAGWGTDAFEDKVSDSYKFPKAWTSIDDRYDARAILKVQHERLAKARRLREQVLRNGFKLGDIEVTRSDTRGLDFRIAVRNGTDGHGVPTGFDAERLIFLQVTVKDSRGNTVYVSGDRDPNGDVRDAHSLYVHNGELRLDKDLFSLQSKFVVRLLRGGEREQVLAVNSSMDVLPLVRPERRATTLFGRPRGARKHKQSIEPGGSRTAEYSVPADVLKRGERYTVTVKLISQMVPVNLIAAIQGAGFDYGMSPAQIAREVVRGASTLWTRTTRVTIQ